MLSLEEAQELMDKLIELRKRSHETKDPKDIKAFRLQEEKCIKGFAYIVNMRTNRYKKFANYEDLVQEGYEALVKGMKNYDPKKGNVFWWLHRYTSTKISRAANFHTVIRFPMKVAKENIPHRESSLPILVEEKRRPDKETENEQLVHKLEAAISLLPDRERHIVSLAFGVGEEEDSVSIGKICRTFSLNRAEYDQALENAMKLLKKSFSWGDDLLDEEAEKMFLETDDLTEEFLPETD